MSNLNKILKLGNPRLHKVSAPLTREELPGALEKAREMHELIMAFRRHHRKGRAMAAPQIGYMKRLIAIHISRPNVLINPVLDDLSQDMMELWDDCMSFPGLLVKVRRHRSCRINYLDENWKEQTWELEDDMSELLQHEYDHLEGILATQRALDDKSFALTTELNG